MSVLKTRPRPTRKKTVNDNSGQRVDTGIAPTRPRIALHLPFASPSQNTLGRWHWGRSAALKRQLEFWILHRLAQAGIVHRVPCEVRAQVIIRRYSCSKLDRGNFIGGCKPLLDALRDLKLIRDDSEKWLDDRYEQHDEKRGEKHMEIEIRYDAHDFVP